MQLLDFKMTFLKVQKKSIENRIYPKYLYFYYYKQYILYCHFIVYKFISSKEMCYKLWSKQFKMRFLHF